MPGRKIPLVTGETYHLFNRGIDHRPTFPNVNKLKRALKLINFYQHAGTPIRYSVFSTWSESRQQTLMNKLLTKNVKLVDVFAYCLMPNHFHLLVSQKQDNGIPKFMANFLNSYTRYHNLKHQRIGPLFLNQYQAVRIETEEQFLHVSRYIHLNPYSAYVVKKLTELTSYPWSSFKEYIENKAPTICQTEKILQLFKTKSAYQQFVFDQADYQKKLQHIKHLLLE